MHRTSCYDSASYNARKRPSPLNRSPSSASSSSSAESSSAPSRRRMTSPTSPLSRLGLECPDQRYHRSASSSSQLRCSSSSSFQQHPPQPQGHVLFASGTGTGTGMHPDAPPPAPTSPASLARAAREQRQKQAAVHSQMQSLFELEYRDEVLAYMYEMENCTMASVELIDMQPELQWYMRPYLVDFLIEIHQQYRLRPETLYLALNIVDRYVSKRIVFKKHYQLVGCAALWIASKFEDAKDRVPTVEDLCAVCCSAYDQSAFIQMEGHVLSTIGWCLGHPTAEAWLRIACAPGPMQAMEAKQTQDVTRFIMEITLFHRAFISIKPSDIALACLVLARHMTQAEGTQRSRERSDVIKIAEMLDSHLAEHLEEVSTTVVKKYSPSFYSRASVLVSEWYLAGRRFSHPYPSGHLPPRGRSDAGMTLPEDEEVDMSSSPSPCSSSSHSGRIGGGQSDYDDEDVDYGDISSAPLTPTTSVGSCPSDPFDQGLHASHDGKLGVLGLHASHPRPSRPANARTHCSMPSDATMKDVKIATSSISPSRYQQDHGRDLRQASTHQWQVNVVPPDTHLTGL